MISYTRWCIFFVWRLIIGNIAVSYHYFLISFVFCSFDIKYNCNSSGKLPGNNLKKIVSKKSKHFSNEFAGISKLQHVIFKIGIMIPNEPLDPQELIDDCLEKILSIKIFSERMFPPDSTPMWTPENRFSLQSKTGSMLFAVWILIERNAALTLMLELILQINILKTFWKKLKISEFPKFYIVTTTVQTVFFFCIVYLEK